MKTLRSRFALALTVAAGYTAMNGVASAAYLTVDFQSDTVGQPPGTASLIEDLDANTRVEVVDGSSSPADPFGGPGNMSLLMQDNSAVNDTRAAWNGGGAGLVTGVFKTQFYLSSAAAGFPSPYYNLRLGINDAAPVSDIATWLYINHPGWPNTIVWDENAGGLNTLDNPLLFNTVNDLEITFDSNTQTMTGKLNGVAMTANLGTKSVFSYYNPHANITSFMFNAGYGGGVGNRVFFDNISLDAPIPEPSMIGLVGLGLAAASGRRQRCRS